MRGSRWSHQGQGYKLGEEVQGDYAMQCLIKHDKADVGSPCWKLRQCLIIVVTLASRL